MRKGFSFVEILIAVAILSTVLIGTYSFISAGGREASRLENLREMSGLLLSAKACVGSFGVPYLRSVGSGSNVPLSFGTGGTGCLTGTTFTGSVFPASAPTIDLPSSFGDAGSGGTRSYSAYFTSGTGGLPADTATATVTVSDGQATKSLTFEVSAQ
jgi:prepilin-type N-terminal cleavage/methylation domain-containing protein